MKKLNVSKIQTVLFAAICGIIAVLLGYLWFTPNLEVSKTRDASGYIEVQNVAYTETENTEGKLVRQFRFKLKEVAYDSTLAFFFSHQNVEVYLDGETVYSLNTSPKLSIVRTPGCNWAMIPLYREDVGKEVLVELTPVYENYQDQKITFLVGSKYAICADQFLRSLPEMLLSFINVIVGIILMFVAAYFSCKHMKEHGIYALALLAISLGMWNFTQTRFAPILFNGRNTLLYYISVTMLMISILPLIKSVRQPKKKTVNRALNCLCIFAALFDVVQLLIQVTGTMDLRRMLMLTHIMLIIGAMSLVVNGFVNHIRALRIGTRPRGNYIWILGFGIIADLMIYYFGGGADGLPVTLFTLLLYTLGEGIQLFKDYVRQQNMLEEKEKQLTMSRITTMMSQIRSHFVFNILNAISGMCKYAPEKADETIVRFARYLRNNIDIMEDDRSVPFSTELERLEDYVILEQVRFGDRIRFETDIEADSFMLPPLILQPLVENAIKHGISKKEDGGTITLGTKETENNIVITIEDDGVGFDTEAPDKNGSIGIKNICFRLEHLVHGMLDISSTPEVGTVVTITIPKEETI